MTSKKERSYSIANATPTSSRLMMRRAYWANKNGYPKHKGVSIAPKWIHNDADRESHQDAINYWWWYELDDKSRAFLGDQYALDITTPDPASETVSQ